MAKRKHKMKTLTARSPIAPTPERYAKNGGITQDVIISDHHGNALLHRFKAAIDCPLDAYFQRSKITATEYQAGMKFRHAYFRAVLKIQAVDSGSGSHGDHEMGMIMPIYSERIVREAYQVLSPSQKSVIIAVCGHDEWAGGAVRIKTLHRGFEVLRNLWRLA